MRVNSAEYRGERFHIGPGISGFDFELNDITATVDVPRARFSYVDKCRFSVRLLVSFKGGGVENFCSRVSTYSQYNRKDAVDT